MTFIVDADRFPDAQSVENELREAFEEVPGGFYNVDIFVEPDPEVSSAWKVDIDCDHDGFTRNDEDLLRHMLDNWFGTPVSDFGLCLDYEVIAED